MPLTSLKQIAQETWLHSGGGPSAGGVCFYMCNFIESTQGIWNNPGTFANAVNAAKDFAKGTAMMNYAKAQSLRRAPQSNYIAVGTTPLASNRIYRAELYVGAATSAVGAPNHEIMIVTGSNNDVIYFEPNFGFFQASNTGMNNTQAIEHFIAQQYGPNYRVGSFRYMSVRAINASTPLSFTA